MSQGSDKAAVLCEPSAAAPAAAAKPVLSWPQVWVILLLLATLCTALMAAEHITRLFIPIIAFIVCLVAAWYDAATAQIPFQITYTAILLGLALNCLVALPGLKQLADWLGTVGPIESLEGLALCGGIGIVSVLVKGMHGGDMKLLAAMGAFLGYSQSIPVLVVALAVAVVYSLINLIVAGRLNWAVSTLTIQFLELIYMRRTNPPEKVSKWYIPLAVPLVIGLMLSRVGIAAKWSFWPFV